MVKGIPTLTQKGREALKNAPPDLSPLCRHILIQVDGKKTIDDLHLMFRGLKGLDEALERLFKGNFIRTASDCHDLIRSLAQQMLGTKAPTLLKKIDELHAKYSDACWEHLDELDKTARLFYGEVIADNLKNEIRKIVKETKEVG
ncbi:MAG TPA: hypothetical protein VK654_11095 [Nitrospirota bacterium]|nr:hypothetical protein [Nitrospirota bacterium]